LCPVLRARRRVMHSCSVRAAGFLQRHVAAYGDWIKFPRFRLTETPRTSQNTVVPLTAN
jgi:hypothetical protein